LLNPLATSFKTSTSRSVRGSTAGGSSGGPDIPLAGPLALLAWLSLPLAAGLIFFAVRARKQGRWSRPMRGFYSLVAVTAVAFAGFLAYWNVLALPF
jgi:hypothetical protein